MSLLAEEDYLGCNKDDTPLSTEECNAYLQRIDGWEIITIDNIPRLSKTFTFKNFTDALDFTNTIGDIAETANHHPAILTEWGRVQVSWWTHSIGGLHHNDFVLAARTDVLYG